MIKFTFEIDRLHAMKVSTFDFNQAKALHFLLEESHVGRAASHLSITPAAASNALRRLREQLGDPLLVKKGRGLVRTRVGEELRAAARDVVASAERLLGAAAPFDPATYRGEFPIAMAEHVAMVLLPALDSLVRERAPHATLAVAPVPAAVSDWLEHSRGVLVGPSGRFAATNAGDTLSTQAFYEDRYVCVLRRGHPLESRRWSAAAYAAQSHVLVTPRGWSQRSDVDEQLSARGLSRHVARVVPSFTLAIPLVVGSNLITTMPERCARQMSLGNVTIREVPIRLRPLAMKIVVHPAHSSDTRCTFIGELLRLALGEADRQSGRHES